MDSQRILETSSDRWQRSLLQAAAVEAAPEAATARVLRALEGLPQPQAAGAAPASLARSGTLKLAGLVVAAVAIGVCAYWLGWRERRAEIPVSPSIAAQKVELPAKKQESPPIAPVPDDQPLAQTDNLPASPPAPAAAKSARGQRSASAGDALSRELRSLRAVRERVQARDASAALRLLAEYRQSFPRGVLQPEAAELERRARELSASH